jgi:hypothetical protein
MSAHLRVLTRSALAASVLAVAALTGCTAAPPPAGPTTASTPTAEPTPTPPTMTEFLATWDDFEVFEASGTGESTFDIPAGLTNGMVTATHDGSSYFEVLLETDTGERAGYPLVQTRGPYTGVTGWGIQATDSTDERRFHIVADGTWTFRLEPVSNAPVLDLPVEGSGDALFQYDGAYYDEYSDAVRVHVVHEGERHFSFAQYFGDRDIELHVNDSGSFEQSVTLEPGPSLFAVTAEAAWRLSED